MALAVTGCSTTDTNRLESFSLGVAAVKAQTSQAFQGVTDLTSDAIIDFAARQPTLKEANLVVVLDEESVAAWDRAFAALEKYSQNLLLLTSPDLTKDYKDSAVSLAGEIKTTGEKLKDANLTPSAPEVSAFLSTAFTKLGDLLLRAKAQSDAKTILTSTDPTVREIFVRMADAIDPSGQRGGLRGTMLAHRQQRKAELVTSFVNTQDQAERRRLVVNYAALLTLQRAQDMALGSLRRSFLALADAHHALANGRNVGVIAAIGVVDQEVKDTKELFNRFRAVTNDKNTEPSK